MASVGAAVSAAVSASAAVRELEASSEWEEVENRPWANEANRYAKAKCVGRDFVKHNPKVLLRFFWNEAAQQLAGTVRFTMESEGPPGGAHGASVALVFDEILAYPVWRTGKAAFTITLTTNFLKMAPLDELLFFESSIERVNGRKMHVRGRITSLDRSVEYAAGTGLWLESKHISTIAMRSYL